LRGNLPDQSNRGVVARAHEHLLFRAMTMETTASIVMEAVRIRASFVPLLAGQTNKKIQDYHNSLMAELRAAHALLNFDAPGFRQLSRQAQTGFAETTEEAADFAALTSLILSDEEILAKALAEAEEVRMDLEDK